MSEISKDEHNQGVPGKDTSKYLFGYVYTNEWGGGGAKYLFYIARQMLWVVQRKQVNYHIGPVTIIGVIKNDDVI